MWNSKVIPNECRNPIATAILGEIRSFKKLISSPFLGFYGDKTDIYFLLLSYHFWVWKQLEDGGCHTRPKLQNVLHRPCESFLASVARLFLNHSLIRTNVATLLIKLRNKSSTIGRDGRHGKVLTCAPPIAKRKIWEQIKWKIWFW